MKRPVAAFGLTLFFGMLVLSQIGSVVCTTVCGAVSFVLLLLFLLIKRERQSALPALLCFGVLAGCFLLLFHEAFFHMPAKEMATEQTPLICEALDYPQPGSNEKRLYVTAKVRLENGKRVPGKVRVSLPKKENRLCGFADDIAPGDTFSFVGNLYVIGGEDKGIHQSFQGKSIYLGAYPTRPAALEKSEKTPVRFFFQTLRNRSMHLLRQRFRPEIAGLLTAVLFGEKSALPEGIYDKFQRAGAAHIMAVSGLHLSAWIFFFLALFRRFGFSERRSAFALLALTVFLMALAAFSPSVLRAGIMMLIYLFGLALRRKSDALTSLGAALCLLLFVRPNLILQLSLQLSVLSTLGIILFALPLCEVLEDRLLRRITHPAPAGLLRAVLTSLIISVCVAVVTLPLQIEAFERLSLVAALSNVLLLPVMLPLLLFGSASLLLHTVPVVAGAVDFLAEGAAKYCLWVTDTLSALPFASVSLGSRTWVWALLFSAAVCALLGWYLIRATRALRRRRLDI